MKIAVSATAPHLDADLDPRFGRCPYLLIIDTETMEFEAVENLAVSAPGGAGIQAAQAVAEAGAQAVVTGNCGPNAYQALSAAGIAVAVGASGSVRQAVEAYQQGRVRPAGGPSASPGHAAAGGWRSGSGWRRGGGGRRGGGPGGGRARPR
jgi:predicted Fe-Mo cluster-binding NifX family protein